MTIETKMMYEANIIIIIIKKMIVNVYCVPKKSKPFFSDVFRPQAQKMLGKTTKAPSI